jgi:hypothetical protein
MDFVYTKFLEWQWAGGSFNPLTDVLKCSLVNETGVAPVYTPNVATDEFINVLPVGSSLATATLTAKTVTPISRKVVLDAADVQFPVVAGSRVDAAVFWIDTGNPATSRLICHYTSVSGFPFTPVGLALLLLLPNSVDKLLSISDV